MRASRETASDRRLSLPACLGRVTAAARHARQDLQRDTQGRIYSETREAGFTAIHSRQDLQRDRRCRIYSVTREAGFKARHARLDLKLAMRGMIKSES